jgi:hypothetical protein
MIFDSRFSILDFPRAIGPGTGCGLVQLDCRSLPAGDAGRTVIGLPLGADRLATSAQSKIRNRKSKIS